jgi:hypothetical protein
MARVLQKMAPGSISVPVLASPELAVLHAMDVLRRRAQTNREGAA